jgi:hypothetical protein
MTPENAAIVRETIKMFAAGIVRKLATDHKKATFGNPIIVNNATALVTVDTSVSIPTLGFWFASAGAQVIRIDSTRDELVVEFKQPHKIERNGGYRA